MQVLVWLAAAWLASLAIVLELFDRAPEMPDDQDPGRDPRLVSPPREAGEHEHMSNARNQRRNRQQSTAKGVRSMPDDPMSSNGPRESPSQLV
jgi:hypothetical protein